MSPKPLTETTLAEIALDYSARYATTRLKLGRYLNRKVKERGWDGSGPPAIDAIVERLADAGAVDDRAYAEMKSGALLRRGYGPARVRATLSAAGVAEEERPDCAPAEAAAAASAYAQRRRLGRYRPEGPGDRDQQRKDMAAMLRAGHRFAVARAALGAELDEEDGA